METLATPLIDFVTPIPAVVPAPAIVVTPITAILPAITLIITRMAIAVSAALPTPGDVAPAMVLPLPAVIHPI